MDFITSMAEDMTNLVDIPYEHAVNIAETTYSHIDGNGLSYHNTDHVFDIVRNYKKHFDVSYKEDQLAIISLWFHNVIYIPGADAGVNEKSSALFAHAMLNNWISKSDQESIYYYIECTDIFKDPKYYSDIFHNKKDLTVGRIRDCDNAGLASPRHHYIQNSINIRKEYNCDDKEWYRQRKKFLELMINRTNVFVTPQFGKYKGQAMKNLKSELDYINNKIANLFSKADSNSLILSTELKGD